jgi:hypothetical protein
MLMQLAFSSTMLLLRPSIVMTVVRHLGYPDYFPLGLGAAKFLALVVLAVPSPRRLKEWAYAGATFDLLAASVSHFAVGDSLVRCLSPLPILLILAGSYVSFVRGDKGKSKEPMRGVATSDSG